MAYINGKPTEHWTLKEIHDFCRQTDCCNCDLHSTTGNTLCCLRNSNPEDWDIFGVYDRNWTNDEINYAKKLVSFFADDVNLVMRRRQDNALYLSATAALKNKRLDLILGFNGLPQLRVNESIDPRKMIGE